MTNIRKVAVCGAGGTMGAGIALVAARAGFQTVCFDMSGEGLARQRKAAEKFFGKSVERGRMTAEEHDAALARLRGTAPGSNCEADMGALSGIKVLELAGMGPTPFCGMLLGDMGADVLRIDRLSATGDGIAMAPAADLRGRNKRSARVDLKHPKGLAALKELIAQADVLIEGYRPGVTERMGIGPEVCLVLNPVLVYARATGWGREGPLAMTAGHDINYLALSGALAMIGPPEAPVPPLNLIGDLGGGALYLAFGVVCALHSARATGRGQVVDAAMIDGIASLLTVSHGRRQFGGYIPERGQNILDGGAPFYTTYGTRDGKFMAVGAIEARFYKELLAGLFTTL